MTARRLLHLVARRGNCREFPDNTLPAVRSAVELGARFIEIDVHLAADCVPMVVHDRRPCKPSSCSAPVRICRRGVLCGAARGDG